MSMGSLNSESELEARVEHPDIRELVWVGFRFESFDEMGRIYGEAFLNNQWTPVTLPNQNYIREILPNA